MISLGAPAVEDFKDMKKDTDLVPLRLLNAARIVYKWMNSKDIYSVLFDIVDDTRRGTQMEALELSRYKMLTPLVTFFFMNNWIQRSKHATTIWQEQYGPNALNDFIGTNMDRVLEGTGEDIIARAVAGFFINPYPSTSSSSSSSYSPSSSLPIIPLSLPASSSSGTGGGGGGGASSSSFPTTKKLLYSLREVNGLLLASTKNADARIVLSRCIGFIADGGQIWFVDPTIAPGSGGSNDIDELIIAKPVRAEVLKHRFQSSNALFGSMDAYVRHFACPLLDLGFVTTDNLPSFLRALASHIEDNVTTTDLESMRAASRD